MLHTPIHGKMTSRKQRCLRSFSSVFQAHQVWNSRQCHSLADKTRFFMRRSLKKYWKSFPFDACSTKIPFLMGRLRPRKYRDFLVSVTVHAILDTWCRGAQEEIIKIFTYQQCFMNSVLSGHLKQEYEPHKQEGNSRQQRRRYDNSNTFWHGECTFAQFTRLLAHFASSVWISTAIHLSTIGTLYKAPPLLYSVLYIFFVRSWRKTFLSSIQSKI